MDSHTKNLRLGHGAGAVGDSESGGLSDGVGLSSLDNLGGSGAEGGVRSDDLSGGVRDGLVCVSVGGSGGGEGNNSGGGRVTHGD